ncbi:MAG: tetratricopeptide repeat protein [Candidatus Heimdallarchaeota archaeon]|nr:tetratricopeptide repeat protein [Candidatus Heimdallarchaeota archaeon]
MSSEEIRAMIQTGKLNEALELLDREEISSELRLLRAKAYLNLGRYERCLGVLESIRIDNTSDQIDHDLIKIEILWRSSQYEKAKELLNKIDENLLVHANVRQKLQFIYNKATWNSQTRNIEEALEIGKIGLSLAEQENEIEYLGIFFNLLGIQNYYLGNYDASLREYYQSLEMKNQIGNIHDIAKTLNNLGEVYKAKGEIEIAVNYHKKSLMLKEKIGNQYEIAISMLNLGMLFHQMKMSEMALSYLERAIDKLNSQNISAIAEGYFSIIQVYIELEELKKAEVYLKKLKQLPENRYCDHVTKISEALILKTSKRSRDRIKAEDLLKSVVDDDIIEHNVTIFALLNLTELLMIEFNLTFDESIFDELKDQVEKLVLISKKHQAFAYIAESYKLQSYLELIDLRFDSAKKLMEQAILITDENDLHLLSDELRMEMKNFENRTIDLLNLGASSTLQDRVMALQLEKQLYNIIVGDKRIERPLYLMILAKSGVTLYTKQFDDDFEMNTSLMAGLLSAFQALSNEIFSEQIENIRIGEYNILLAPSSNFDLCYVFIGDSHTAENKIKRFLNKILQVKLMEPIEKAIMSQIESQFPTNEVDKVSATIFS